MAEKEVTLKIQADVDDSQVQDLENLLQQIVDGKITIPVETDSSELEEVEARIEELEQKRADIYMGVDDSDLEEVEAELDELEQRQIELTVDADSSSVDDAEDKVDNLDGKEVTVNVGADTSSAEESISGLEEALTAVGAGVALAGMEQMVATAGNIQDSWNRLGLTFGEVTGQMKTDIAEAGEATGRSGSLVRGFFNDMGMAGIRNTELLQSSFEALSGRAYQTGASIESLEQKVKMMVMSGNAGARQLTQLGITTADLGRVMGVSADEASKMFKSLSQEERLRVLTQAMGDGKEANEMYKNSWQGLKEQIDKATGALMGAIGSAILPVLIPVMKAAADVITFVADAFKKLPEPIRAVIGIVGALIMGFLAYQTVMAGMRALNIVGIFTDLIGVLRGVTMAQLASNAAALANPYVLIAVAIIALIAALWYLYNTNEAVRNAFNHVGEALKQVWDVLVTAFKPVIDAVTEAWNELMDSLGGSDSVMDGLIFYIVAFAEGLAAIIRDLIPYVKLIVETYSSMAKTIIGVFRGTGEEGNTWLGNMLFILMGPIGWIILLCNHFEWFRDIVVGALTFIVETFTQMFDTIVGVFTGTSTEGNTWLGNMLFILMGPIGWIMLLIQAWNQIGPAVSSALQGMYQSVVNWFNQTGARISSFASSIVSQLGSAAWNAVSSFASGISNLGQALRDELNGMLNDAANFVGEIGQTMWNAAVNAWNQFLAGLQRHSPGKMMREFEAEMTGIVQYAKDTETPLGSAMHDVASGAVDSFNPNFNLGGGAGSGGAGTAINNEFNFVINGDVDSDERMRMFAEYIIELMNWDNDTAGRTV